MRCSVTVPAFTFFATSVLASVSFNPSNILHRSDDTDEGKICQCYGIDFQNHGSYFIDSQSTASFTCVSQFEHSQGDPAYIVLIRDDDDDDQWECTSIPTKPDNTSQLSTCPITKDQMTTGNWTIITMGNNANGTAFAWERNFYLSVGVPETITTTPTATYTQTTTPSTTATTTSIIIATNSVNNTLTITSVASTVALTVTPERVTTTSAKIMTRTSNTWTKTLDIITETVIPTCTIPSRPNAADPPASHTPTVVPIPKGVKIASKRSLDQAPKILQKERKRFESEHAAKDRLQLNMHIARRSPDAPTLTHTATEPVNTTITFTAPETTFTDIFLTTSTTTMTGPPVTLLQGVTSITITALTPTTTILRIGYTTQYVIRTMEVTWTSTTTTTPAPDATACKSEGGHFGHADL